MSVTDNVMELKKWMSPTLQGAPTDSVTSQERGLRIVWGCRKNVDVAAHATLLRSDSEDIGRDLPLALRLPPILLC